MRTKCFESPVYKVDFLNSFKTALNKNTNEVNLHRLVEQHRLERSQKSNRRVFGSEGNCRSECDEQGCRTAPVTSEPREKPMVSLKWKIKYILRVREEEWKRQGAYVLCDPNQMRDQTGSFCSPVQTAHHQVKTTDAWEAIASSSELKQYFPEIAKTSEVYQTAHPASPRGIVFTANRWTCRFLMSRQQGVD
jgi:hypothetical protein